VWLTDVSLVLPDGVLEGASLRFEDGLIAELRDGPAPHADVHGRGCLLLPGLVDLHGDMLERDLEPRPKAIFPTDLALFELDKRLAGLGVTTAFAAVSFMESRGRGHLRSEERARDIIGVINRLRETLLVDMRVHARFEITNPNAGSVLSKLLEKRQVHLVSLNDHTPGQGQYRDLERHIRHIAAWRGISEEEARQQALERVARVKEQPPSWTIIRDICERAARQGLIVASHDDDTVQKVDLVADVGVALSEFPVSFEAAREAKRRGMRVVMGAPNAYRGHSNSGNLSAQEAIREGLVDILASDYYPAALLHAVFKLAAEKVLPLHEAVKLVTQHPATAAGLQGRGSLEVGKRADLVLVEPGTRPRVRGTLRAGRVIYWDGHLAARSVATPLEVHV